MEYREKQPPSPPASEIVTLLVGSSILSLGPAFLQRAVFDRVLPEFNEPLLWKILLLVLFVEAATLITGRGAERRLALRERRGKNVQRRSLAQKIWKLPTSWFDARGAGAVERLFDDSGRLGGLSTLVLRDILRPAISLMFVLPALFFIHPVLALIQLATFPPALWAGRRFLGKELALERFIWNLRGRLTTRIADGTDGVNCLKLGRAEKSYGKRMERDIALLGEREEQRRLLAADWEAVGIGINRLGSVVVFGLAMREILHGNLSFGAFIAFSILGSKAARHLGALSGGFRRWTGLSNPRTRLGAVCPEPRVHGVPRQPTGRHSGSGLAIENLEFGFPGGGEILRGVHLTIRPGERVSLIGRSGTGKSTLIALILGLYQPWRGRILWDGVDVSRWAPEYRRLRFGAVLQEVAVFTGTLRENLTLFRPAPSDSRLHDVLREAGAAALARSLPRGLDTPLGAGGAVLSGGQRQLLGVARLTLSSPDLILLDEASSAMDDETENGVRTGLQNICRNRATLVVGHRGRIVKSVDRMAVLSGGTVRYGESHG